MVNISTYQVDFHPDKLNVGVLVKHWMISDKHNIIFLQQSKVDISINHFFPFVPFDEFISLSKVLVETLLNLLINFYVLEEVTYQIKESTSK